MTLTIYNTLTRRKEPFEPIDASNVRMYVCGPTVYDFAHIGNARPVVVFDVLYRLLRHTYGADHVTYVRNITDVDDKIIAAAKDSGEDISAITERFTDAFHADMAALGERHDAPRRHTMTSSTQTTRSFLPNPDMEIDPTNTALVVTDPQNDFLSPDGVTWEVVGKSVEANNTVENIETLFKLAKASGIRDASPVLCGIYRYILHL